MTPEGPEALRVLVADDHVLFREGVTALIAADPSLELVGAVATGEAAVEEATATQPDVVLMDIRMPGISGIDATRLITSASPHIGVLILTMFEDDHLVFAALRAGARGYLLKDAGREEVLRAVRAVGTGEAIFSASIARRFMDYFAELRPVPTRQAFPAIAQRLRISSKTVRNHLSNVLSKLQVEDRAEAILKARDAGLG